jgi:hypothetical protein
MERKGCIAQGALALALGLAGVRAAHAAGPCDALAPPATTWGGRVAAAACAEHRLWYSPFLDDRGRLERILIAEAESTRLADKTTPAWRRVADYWKGSGLLWSMASRNGANDCGLPDAWPSSAACRAFVVDTPWSAVFVSYAYLRAGIPGFSPSASHIDFVRQALQGGAGSPLRFADPEAEAPAVGDLLCFTRGLAVPMGAAGLRAFVAGGGNSLAMHCDIVVDANDGKDGRLYTVGGNVMQGVTLRTLHVNRNGALWGLPHSGTPYVCAPGADTGCNFNRQDWVALLKLEPKAPPPAPEGRKCCTACPLPMPPDMQRCPATTTAPSPSTEPLVPPAP